MTVNCELIITGILPEDSMNAFMKSYYQTSKVSHYKKFQGEMQQYFKEKMEKSIKNNDIHVEGLSDSFELDMKNDRIEFSSSMAGIANKYEYGNKDAYPRRFIEPVVVDVANKMSDKIIDEAIDMYNRNVMTTTQIKTFSSVPKIKKPYR